MKKHTNVEDFNFFVPLDVEKAEQKAGQLIRIRGIASTPNKDLQGEIVSQKGLDISNLLEGKGLFNLDHGKGMENVIGKIDKAKLTKEGLLVEGYLFPDVEKAKVVNNIMRGLKKGDEKRMQFSIEGKVLKRDGKRIERAKVTNIALTLQPINDNTYAEFAKSFADSSPDSQDDSPTTDEKLSENHRGAADDSLPENDHQALDASLDIIEFTKRIVKSEKEYITIEKAKFLKILEKAGMNKAIDTGSYAYGDSAPSKLTGGAAMQTESVDKKIRKVTVDPEIEKKKKKKKDKIKSLLKKIRKSYSDLPLEKQVDLALRIYREKFSQQGEK